MEQREERMYDAQITGREWVGCVIDSVVGCVVDSCSWVCDCTVSQGCYIGVIGFKRPLPSLSSTPGRIVPRVVVYLCNCSLA